MRSASIIPYDASELNEQKRIAFSHTDVQHWCALKLEWTKLFNESTAALNKGLPFRFYCFSWMRKKNSSDSSFTRWPKFENNFLNYTFFLVFSIRFGFCVVGRKDRIEKTSRLILLLRRTWLNLKPIIITALFSCYRQVSVLCSPNKNWPHETQRHAVQRRRKKTNLFST